MSNYKEALRELRITANFAGDRSAWLTKRQAVALLERLERRCEACESVCSHEPLRVLCDDCAGGEA